MDLPYSLRVILENLVRHHAPADQVRAVIERDTTEIGRASCRERV